MILVLFVVWHSQPFDLNNPAVLSQPNSSPHTANIAVVACGLCAVPWTGYLDNFNEFVIEVANGRATRMTLPVATDG